MALKVLLLRNKLEMKKNELDNKRNELKEIEKREAETEKAIKELTEKSTEEERSAVNDAVDNIVKLKDEIQTATKALEDEILKIETEIGEEESEQEPQDETQPPTEEIKSERKKEFKMNTRTKFFGMSAQEREAFISNPEVKNFLERTRNLGKENRAITGAELTIPTVVLDLLRDNINDYSKLIKKVRQVNVPGKARQTIMGTIPEAVWTEMCANINELTFKLNAVEVDGYKVGGYIAICNAILEDSDLNLATEIINALGHAIGFALDKAIIYGRGVKMPMGIVTRLAQTTKPADYPVNFREWENLSATNLLKLDAALEGVDFYKAFVLAASAAKTKYSKGTKFWVMNETTHAAIISKSIANNAAGAFVSGLTNTMPVVNGDIIILDFIPDGDIIGGYSDVYLLAERAGATIAKSEHVRFLEDQMVFKGVARYDGIPVIAEDFVAININGVEPTTSIAFAEDTANEVVAAQ